MESPDSLTLFSQVGSEKQRTGNGFLFEDFSYNGSLPLGKTWDLKTIERNVSTSCLSPLLERKGPYSVVSQRE